MTHTELLAALEAVFDARRQYLTKQINQMRRPSQDAPRMALEERRTEVQFMRDEVISAIRARGWG